MSDGLSRGKSIKELVLQAKLLESAVLDQAEGRAKEKKKALHQQLVDEELVGKNEVLDLLSSAWSVKTVDLGTLEPQEDLIKLVPESVSRRYVIVPFAKTEEELSVAMADPRDFFISEDINMRTGLNVTPFLAMPQDIHKFLDAVYGESEGAVMDKLLASVSKFGGKASSIETKKEEKTDITDIDASAPEVEKFVNAIILGALNFRASDIHIEPFEDPTGKTSRVIIRYRIDGMLREANFVIPWSFRGAVIAKIKIMTNSMDITERRIPQSGRIQILSKGNPIEFRVEVVPTVYGESCVMRILDRKAVQVNIEKLSFMPDTLDKFLGLLKGIGGKKNFGLILVCGPTGSGKSTTLYAALNHVNRPDIKILTAENPVEYNIDGIVQVPVNPDIKLGEDKRFDFATALRSFLRLDPDVIMVGEIRDEETAHIAMEAAMTGHLVFSTIHTNDAPSALSRLVEMGLPSYVVVATMKAVLAQRLARRLCEKCKQAYDPSEADMLVFKETGVSVPPGSKLYRPVGCPACDNSGFSGRIGMHELLVMTDTMRAFALNNHSAGPLRDMAVKEGMRTISQDGLEKALKGWTTLREVLGGVEDKVEKDEEKKK
ncbi:MAG: Flp pilus assembly complex ATPase component TadA [Elusimicrobia bacterium]|nr:Flp pilus assembly complex ATPase component TadA [Elusimicrobiota bacterium]